MTHPARRQMIRAGRGALEGERKQVTVLFADVMGSMELAATGHAARLTSELAAAAS